MSMSAQALADFQRQPSPAWRIPKLSTKPAAYVAGHQYRAKGVPAGEQATYWELAGQFRGGDLYAFSWDTKRGAWEIWRTEDDWWATERNGTVRSPDLAAQGCGPAVFESVKPERKPRGVVTHSVSMCNTCQPVGIPEIADRLHVRRFTVDRWRQRGLLPVPRWTVGGSPAWSWSDDIEPWANETGRLPE